MTSGRAPARAFNAMSEDLFETSIDVEAPVYTGSPADGPGVSSSDDASGVDRYTVFQQRRRGLKLGRFGVVLPAGLVYEIVESVRISPMPGVTSLFKGFVNHRGNVAPVYDLAELTGEQQAWDRKRLLIINNGPEAAAIKLYELPVPVRNEYSVPNTFLDSVPEVFHQHVQQAYRTTDMLWLEMDIEAFFDALSRLCLKADQQDNHRPE